ncbi:MAG TPA: hypothetical protein PKJ08_11980 [Candidatus Cloacimonadota bacterium]|nr:hypothetical protein [Candidatus Cloacimonadota bacterium]
MDFIEKINNRYTLKKIYISYFGLVLTLSIIEIILRLFFNYVFILSPTFLTMFIMLVFIVRKYQIYHEALFDFQDFLVMFIGFNSGHLLQLLFKIFFEYHETITTDGFIKVFFKQKLSPFEIVNLGLILMMNYFIIAYHIKYLKWRSKHK